MYVTWRDMTWVMSAEDWTKCDLLVCKRYFESLGYYWGITYGAKWQTFQLRLKYDLVFEECD